MAAMSVDPGVSWNANSSSTPGMVLSRRSSPKLALSWPRSTQVGDQSARKSAISWVWISDCSAPDPVVAPPL